MATIGERMKKLRISRDLTLEDVAKLAGVSRQTIQRYESGVIGNIPSDKIEAIAKVLNVTPAYLMGWEDDDDNQDNEGYYTNPETAKMAQELYDNPNLRILFNAVRRVSPEDLKFVGDLVERMKKEENHEEE